MTWFGTVSAWAALAMGALFGVNAYFQFATGVTAYVFVVTALALLLGGYRTLRKQSGGLRLLAGAWGLAAGLLAINLRSAPPMPEFSPNADYYAVTTSYSWIQPAFFFVALIGLALTVLHKERK